MFVGDEKKKSFTQIAPHIKKKKKTPEFSKKLTENDFSDTQNRQILKVNLAKKWRFLGPLSTYELYFWIFCDEKKLKSFTQIAPHI